MAEAKNKKKKVGIAIGIGAGVLVSIGILASIGRKKTVEENKNYKKDILKNKNDKFNFKKMTPQEFIAFLSPSVKVISQKYGIPYKFMMAQMALETGWGKSELFYKYFNVGGIRSFHPEKEANTLAWTHEVVLPADLPKWDKWERNKAKDVKVIKNGVEYVNISVKLPFRTFPGLVEGLTYYLNNVLLNKYFKPYIAEANGDADKYVDLLQSGKYGAKYATALNYPATIKGLFHNFV